MEADEYEKRDARRRNDNFIVDDDDGIYQDGGGEIWEYEDYHDQPKSKKNKKLNNVSRIFSDLQ